MECTSLWETFDDFKDILVQGTSSLNHDFSSVLMIRQMTRLISAVLDFLW